MSAQHALGTSLCGGDFSVVTPIGTFIDRGRHLGVLSMSGGEAKRYLQCQGVTLRGTFRAQGVHAKTMVCDKQGWEWAEIVSVTWQYKLLTRNHHKKYTCIHLMHTVNTLWNQIQQKKETEGRKADLLNVLSYSRHSAVILRVCYKGHTFSNLQKLSKRKPGF